MKIKDIVKKTAVLLDREDVISFIEKGYADSYGSTQKDVAAFVTAVNFVINELATEYLPVEKWERKGTTGNKLYFSSLNYTVAEIKKVTDENGNELTFKVFPEYITADSATVDVLYVALPSNADLDENVIYDEKDIPLRIIAYGTAREICIMQGRFDEANEWEAKFEKGLSALVKPISVLNKLKNVMIKGRNFY